VQVGIEWDKMQCMSVDVQFGRMILVWL
jgi:hypothetical protein